MPGALLTSEKAAGFLDLCFDARRAAEITLQPIRRFGFDAAILFSDILVVPYALGQHVTFVGRSLSGNHIGCERPWRSAEAQESHGRRQILTDEGVQTNHEPPGNAEPDHTRTDDNDARMRFCGSV